MIDLGRYAPESEYTLIQLTQVGVKVLLDDAETTNDEGRARYQQQAQNNNTYRAQVKIVRS